MARIEGLPIPEGIPADTLDLVRELIEIESNLMAVTTMEGWQRAVRIVESRAEENAAAYLLVLDANKRRIRVHSFGHDEVSEAYDEYLNAEESATRSRYVQTVLVHADSIDALQRAYPNYYADTGVFIQTLKQIVS